jgi:hypothetical protein
VTGGNLDQDNPGAVGILDPHLDQSPGLRHGLPDDRDPGRGQPGMLPVDIPYLDPDHHRAPRRAGRAPGDLKQSLAEEENHPRMIRGTELPVDGQAQDVPVEAETAV